MIGAAAPRDHELVRDLPVPFPSATDRGWLIACEIVKVCRSPLCATQQAKASSRRLSILLAVRRGS